MLFIGTSKESVSRGVTLKHFPCLPVGNSGAYRARVKSLRKNSFTIRAVKWWNRLPSVGSPASEVFKKRLDKLSLGMI